MSDFKIPVEPFKIKVVEAIKKISQKEREKLLKECGFNVFNIPSEKVYIDLLTDSGTSAMSDHQWAGMMTGDESYAGSKSFFNFEKSVKSVFGFNHVIPTHQGRAAERILFQTVLKKGDVVVNNIHFDTTRANIEVREAEARNLVIDEAYNPDSDFGFKGNMDLEKLENFFNENEKEKTPLVMITLTNNSGGGQPVSLKNIKDTSRLCRKYGIPFFFDACRFAENAYFIKKREKDFSSKSMLEISKEMFSYADGATMSAKKDALVNIGGFVTLNDDFLAQKIKNLLIIGEGFLTYGGLAGRDLEAISRGIQEVLDEDYLEYRVNQVQYLGNLLKEAGIPVFNPIGGHAVYILADQFLPHLPRHQFPGWTLTVELYRKSGVRAVEIGGVMFSKTNEQTGEVEYPKLELVRLAIPRRVYTVSHLNYIADSLKALYKERSKIKGLKIIYQPEHLRHFTARFEQI
ncbi:MAG: tryptophanase [Candidatus Aminicenantaceae bacterium]